MGSYILIRYKEVNNIIDFLKRKDIDFINDEPTSENKHFNYIDGYFREIGVETIVFELNYVDKDYLEDFSNYYSRCYKDYRKKCIRLHCFNKPISNKRFKSILASSSVAGEKFLNHCYLGFVIFRPLPLTLFGRTCLKTYPEKDQKNPSVIREYTVLRQYEVNLFGILLKISSLGFQEQDMAISACATSALWSAFQGTGHLFHHHYPTPYEITLNATKHIIFTNRSFPNKGLMGQQMAIAIRSVNLEPLLISYVLQSYFKAHLRAFLKCGIPVIIGLELYDIRKSETGPTKIGFHAVVVTGYGIKDNGQEEFELIPEDAIKNQRKYHSKEINKFFLMSAKIQKLYVHDDQIGPFAMMEFIKGSKDELTTDWATFVPNKYEKVIAKPITMLVPLYHKIRIPFLKIKEIICDFDTQTLDVLNANLHEIMPSVEIIEYEWDIYLNTISEFKKNIRKNESLDEKTKLRILTRDFPKYVWIADAYHANKPAFTYIFDATDIENGKLFLSALHYDDSFPLIREIALSDLYKEQTFQSRVILDEYRGDKQPNIYHKV